MFVSIHCIHNLQFWLVLVMLAMLQVMVDKWYICNYVCYIKLKTFIGYDTYIEIKKTAYWYCEHSEISYYHNILLYIINGIPSLMVSRFKFQPQKACTSSIITSIGMNWYF